MVNFQLKVNAISMKLSWHPEHHRSLFCLTVSDVGNVQLKVNDFAMKPE